MVTKMKVNSLMPNKEVKLAPKIDPSVLKYKIVSRTIRTNNVERQKPAISTPTINE